MNIQKMDDPIKGVKCMVDTCMYHMSGEHCGAEHIEVRTKGASSSEQTDCATFMPEK